jgi:large subunit ribosomal protein L25
MAFDFEIEYQSRSALGKGASRRLRREQDMVPGIVYGDEKAPESIMIEQRHLRKALENEAVYSHILKIKNGANTEQVVLKNLQRHPYKAYFLHIDFQRISATKPITMHVPIHFLNEELCLGVKEGGIIAHLMTDLEIRCLAKDLPEFINIDLQNLTLDESLHLSDIKLPSGVELTVDVSENNQTVVSVHMPRAAKADDEGTVTAAEPESENATDKDKK